MDVKSYMRSALAALSSSPPIVVNSFGRSGSTVVYEAVVAGAVREARVGRRVASRTKRRAAWDLTSDPLLYGSVYKSHDYPCDRLGGSAAKVVYIFGNPVDATVSAFLRARRQGDAWLHEHCSHLRVDPCAKEDLLERDALHIAEHFEAWMRQQYCETLFIHYDHIWNAVDSLVEFVGHDVVLPTRKQRLSEDSVTLSPQLAEEFSIFNSRLESLPPVFVRKDS